MTLTASEALVGSPPQNQISLKSGYNHILEHRAYYDVSKWCPGSTTIRGDRTEDYVRIIEGSLFLFEGYAWDGATGVPDTKPLTYASLFHDGLCQLIREQYLSSSAIAWANQVLREAFERKALERRRFTPKLFIRFQGAMILRGVQIFGRRASTSAAIRRVITI